MSVQTAEVRELEWVGKNLCREDGAEKATGEGIFATDLHLPHMLYGKYPEAMWPTRKF
ncbi:MAG: hypothetical protein ACE5JS_14765 [Nitrospinota bacterium]